jgi:tRNA wybutosine-synthesizing protein 4
MDPLVNLVYFTALAKPFILLGLLCLDYDLLYQQRSPFPPCKMGSNVDRTIMATAEDAIQTKHAAVNAGYYSDDFIQPFYQSSVRRRRQVQPIIKRGTHARVCCMDRAISAFCNANTSTRRQIVVVGAGKDTSYFRYLAGSIMGMGEESALVPCNWYEVDHRNVIEEKTKIIEESPLLSSHCPLTATPYGSISVHRDKKHKYHLVEHDLREDHSRLLEKLGLDTTLPTLFLMECVLMYIPDAASKALLAALSKAAKHSWIVCYEPILGSDPFGRMMQQNLVQAGVATQDSCLLRVRTLQGQLEKMIEASFSRAVGCDMWSAYQTVLTQDQRQRANQCEFLDEIEEWILIMQHYCFFAATTGDNEGDSLTSVSDNSPLGFAPKSCQVLTTE